MVRWNRRRVLGASLAGFSAALPTGRAGALTASLSDVGAAMVALPVATVFTAREIVTLDPARPSVQAVAVVNGRVLATGSLAEVTAALGDQPHTVNTAFADYVIVPGFIAQHDHPVLAALTMSSEILSIEDWVLPGRVVRAVRDQQDFLTRLAAASHAMTDPTAPLLSWGYHPSFFGPLTRDMLDGVSPTRPIIVWGRSCHEFFLNSAALKAAGVNEAAVEAFPASARSQSNLAEGHFWEQGMFALLPLIAHLATTPARFAAGLELTRDYMHAKGITFGNEPGGILSKPVQDAVNTVFSSADMPFRWTFMVDGKSMVAKYADDAEVIAQSRQLASWYAGMTSLAPNQAKLFADGAIFSQRMQLRQPYLDQHTGDWMMDVDVFDRAFRLYWDAGYQIHIHVNGDAGVDRVLDALEANMRRNPRYEHRTLLAHLAVSDPDQVARIKTLGAIASGNPYYVSALADQYEKVGLGPERADNMVRLGDLTRAGISWSLHSDMPMAPADPLFLMWCAVNRITASGRTAGPSQRVSPELALHGVTLAAAYSHGLEDELGSITPGKRANMTVLQDNPLTVDPKTIKDIKVWGTVMEGRVFAAGQAGRKAEVPDAPSQTFAEAALGHALKVAHVGL
jgi:predicted amidohydrolase YtcJ